MEYNLTISYDKKFVWFRVAKCATRTIYRILSNVKFDKDGYNLTYEPYKYNDFFKFAFIRNPFDRLVSCYFNKVHKRENNVLSFDPNMSFKDFVEMVYRTPDEVANIHFRSQSKLMPKNMDFIGKLEKFDEDINCVLNKLDIQIDNIPRINTTTRKHYSYYYNRKLIDMVKQRYEVDLKAFGFHLLS